MHREILHLAMDKARRHPHLHTFQSRKQSINVNMGHNMQYGNNAIILAQAIAPLIASE